MIDFETYWQQLKDDLQAAPADWERIERHESVTAHGKTWRVDWLRFSSLNDSLIWGWLATPAGHAANGAGFLWLPGYSYGTPPPDETNLVEGVATMAINVHGNPPDTPYVNPAGKNDYLLQGIESPSSYIYRAIAGHSLRALDILAEQPGVDRERLCVGGMSQGGTLALIVAAQDSRAKLCFADMPFFCDIRHALNLSRSPAYQALKTYLAHHPDTADDALNTVLLFDPFYHAPKIAVPTWMSAGGRDPASKPATIEAVYQKIASPIKEYRFFPHAGHVFLPEMNEKYNEWIQRYLIAPE